MKSLLILFVVSAPALAFLELPFRNAHASFYETYVEALIGSPGQSLNLSLSLYDSCPGLSVYSSKVKPNGFNYSASATFHETEQIPGKGVMGTDDFYVAFDGCKYQVLKQQPFSIFDTNSCTSYSSLSLAASTENRTNEFMDSVLKTEKEKVAVLTYNNVPRKLYQPFSGLLSLGSSRPDLCSTEWKTAPETSGNYGVKWQVKLDRIGSGKFNAYEPGNAYIGIDTHFLYLSYKVIGQIRNELGAVEGEYMYYVPCNSTTDIVYTINGWDLHIKPEDYMDKSSKSRGYCYFNGYATDENKFEIPAQVFDRYCAKFDYEKKEVGFAEKL